MRKLLFILLLFFVGSSSIQAQDGLFQKQTERQFFIESEVLPWLNSGINVKAGIMDEKRTFGIRYATQSYVLEDVFEGTFTQVAPNADIEQSLSLAVEYHFSPLHNFYIGTWIGYETWDIPLLLTKTTITNWFMEPQIGYKWIPLNNVYINAGYRAKLTFGEKSEDGLLSDNFAFKNIITTPTIALGLKF